MNPKDEPMSATLTPALGAAASTTPTLVELSVVMPVYNEEEALPDVLDEAVMALRDAEIRAEILLVDDASKDRSLAILQDYERHHPSLIRVLRHEINRGIVGACQTLYDNARGRYVFIIGSDGQWKTAEALRMMALRDRFDLIVGRRQQKQYDWRRKVVSGAFNLLPRLLFGVNTHDAGSIKLFRRDILDIRTISRGPFREAERIIRASDAGLRVGVIDVEHFSRHGGVAGGAKVSLIKQSIGDLFRCWWDMRVRRRRRP
jgi:glycosyltransferase involved in cell wall biosynthesis